ncbi:unnamed protein product [Prorocentrum cordatum]|uniref:Transmembrane protein 138 n=1 Tax=Prorocentrum cordatum TaxID=2364126 RepID=A0ABN9RTR2_9DINO|nr:unnamed protein product [Polarella glacialis]
MSVQIYLFATMYLLHLLVLICVRADLAVRADPLVRAHIPVLAVARPFLHDLLGEVAAVIEESFRAHLPGGREGRLWAALFFVFMMVASFARLVMRLFVQIYLVQLLLFVDTHLFAQLLPISFCVQIYLSVPIYLFVHIYLSLHIYMFFPLIYPVYLFELTYLSVQIYLFVWALLSVQIYLLAQSFFFAQVYLIDLSW